MAWRRGCVWVKEGGGGPEAIQSSGLGEIMKTIKRTECSKKGVVLEGKQSLGSTWEESTYPRHCLCLPTLGPLWTTTTASSCPASLSLLLPHILHHSTKLSKVSPSHPLAWISLPVSWHLPLSSPGLLRMEFVLSLQSGSPDLSGSTLDGLGDVWGAFASPVPCAVTSGQQVPPIPLLHPTHLVFGSTSAKTMKGQLWLLASRRLNSHFSKMGPTFQKWEEKASHIGVVLWRKPTSHLPCSPVRMIHREPPLHLLPAISLCTARQKSIAVFIRGQTTCSIIYNFDYTHFSPSSSFAQTSPPNVLYHSSFFKKNLNCF